MNVVYIRDRGVGGRGVCGLTISTVIHPLIHQSRGRCHKVITDSPVYISE